MKHAYKNICSIPLYYYQTRFCSRVVEKDSFRRFNPFAKRKFRSLEDEKPKYATRICLSVLGNGAFGQPRCLALFTEFKAYLFNCGEGTGRLCREHELNMSQLRHIFITQKVWKNMSGLPDIYLTHRAFGVRSIALHGPPGIELFKSVIASADLNVSFENRSYSKNSYVDSTVEVEYVPVESEGYVSNSRPLRMDGDVFVKESKDVCYSYICQIFEKPGDLSAEKCVDMGVPIGAVLLKLKNGEDVQLSCGRIIRSSDVHNDPYNGLIFLVVDCPSIEFLDSFLNEKKFERYQLPNDAAFDVSAVFHFSPPAIVKSDKYQEWMARFHQNSQHFLLNNDNATASSETVLKIQNVLHLLHPKIFSLLREKENPSSSSFLNAPFSVIQSPAMLQLHVRPEKKLHWSNVIGFNYEDYIQSVKELPGVEEKLNDLYSALKCNSLKEGKEYPEVVFLGTGSSTSSAFRNVSAILVNVGRNQTVLLDCGEGSLMQMVRYYGVDKSNVMLKNISCIFVSHKHTDHYLGLFELIKARIDAFEKSNEEYQTLALILPKQIYDIWHIFCDIFEDFSSKVKIFSPQYFKNGREKYGLKSFLGNVILETVPVMHCSDAYGAVLYLPSEWKIVYSGDTAPCQRLVDAGKNCTLLIHEASIEDGLINEASFKKHSTPSQVAEISEMMNAQYTIMTHFSKRYLAVPVIQESNHKHIACSFDFMKVRLCDLPILPLFLPVLRTLFQEQLEIHSERTNYVTSFENVLLKTLKS
ncbi:zinc phosphodiesterase ELAC protein 2-like [Uloborus diversus]|uniref:zinc phosphodiesterase ELAC protein 2-like n=1 Tax=Uloborus diversus TaxID=327109 RepID=UPI002409B974|nr:zinc phosphodiesterase ELAC protein 2-like [Uloborus diversus]